MLYPAHIQHSYPDIGYVVDAISWKCDYGCIQGLMLDTAMSKIWILDNLFLAYLLDTEKIIVLKILPDSLHMLWETQASALAVKQLFVWTFVVNIDWGMFWWGKEGSRNVN